MNQTPPPSDRFVPVATVADLQSLDEDEIVAGYLDFRAGDPEPSGNRGRAFWHGWCNAARDHGALSGSAASRGLAVEASRGLVRQSKLRSNGA